MKLRNIRPAPAYCGLTTTTLKTGVCTAELGFLVEALNRALNNPGFDILLTDEEKSLMGKLLEKDKEGQARDVAKLPGFNDPYGRKRLQAEADARLIAKQKLEARIIQAARDKEASMQDRFPEDKKVELSPKRLDGRPSSLTDIKRHNASLKEENNG